MNAAGQAQQAGAAGDRPLRQAGAGDDAGRRPAPARRTLMTSGRK
jgi:hypothetical protein